jgi:hypothetical protein
MQSVPPAVAGGCSMLMTRPLPQAVLTSLWIAPCYCPSLTTLKVAVVPNFQGQLSQQISGAATNRDVRKMRYWPSSCESG